MGKLKKDTVFSQVADIRGNWSETCKAVSAKLAEMKGWSWQMSQNPYPGAQKRTFCAVFNVKTILFTRQARDKHRGNLIAGPFSCRCVWKRQP